MEFHLGKLEPGAGSARGWQVVVSATRIAIAPAAIVLALGSAPPASAQLSTLCADRQFNVRFAAGSDRLDPNARRQLGEEIQGLRGCRLRHVVVVSFGDEASAAPQSRLLGERRSESVSAGLTQLGVPTALILTRAGPSSRALADTSLNGEAEIHIQLSSSLP